MGGLRYGRIANRLLGRLYRLSVCGCAMRIVNDNDDENENCPYAPCGAIYV